LINESYYFPNGNYLIGGGKTSDSDFATNTSLYPLFDSSVFVQHGRHDYTSLPKALKEDGYFSYAYHAYKRDFWNRGLGFNSLGFEHFYAADNYPEGENIIMGLNDEDFYKETLKKIKEKEEPSYHYLNSLTSHYPFDMAKKYQFLPGNESDYDYRTFHYLQSIHYADYAIGKFLKS
jgi:lipoteichoic acid synthase